MLIRQLLQWQRGESDADFLLDSKVNAIITYEANLLSRKYPLVDYEDIVQQSYLVLLEKLKSFEVPSDHPEQSLLSYIRQTLRSSLNTFLQRDAIQSSQEEFSEEEFYDLHSDSQPEQILINSEHSTKILENIDTYLTAKQAQVVKAYYIEQLSQAEIAEQLGISQQAVSRLLRDALHKLSNTIDI